MSRIDRVSHIMNGGKTSSTRMACLSESDFWDIIDWSTQYLPSQEKQRLELIKLLATMTNYEMLNFNELFTAIQRLKMPFERIRNVFESIEFSPSDDGEHYFYAWLIGQGSKIYSEIWLNPKYLVKYLEKIHDPDESGYPPFIEHEELAYVGTYAYRKMNGRDVPDRSYNAINLLGLRPNL